MSTLGMPILEIEVPAVADKVPAPDRLYLANGPFVDQFFHLLNHCVVPQVMANIQTHAALGHAGSDIENAIAPLGGNRQGLFGKGRLTRFQ